MKSILYENNRVTRVFFFKKIKIYSTLPKPTAFIAKAFNSV